MPIMNYTTKVDAFKSIGEISSNLSKHGAKRIMQEYGNSGEPIAIAFSIDTGYGERFYSLPARVDAVHETLTKQKVIWQGKMLSLTITTTV